MATIYTTKGDAILVDDEDYTELSVFTWWLNDSGYAVRRAKLPDGRWGFERMHRRLMGLTPSDGREVDHRNNNRSDNRRANLRNAIHAENCRNQLRHRDNRSGFKGVTKHPLSSKWQARIRINGKQKHLGMFETPELAHEFYYLAADMLHEAFANHGTRA